MTDDHGREPEVIHRLRNQLAVVVSFSDLLLLELPDGDPHRADVVEIHKAARAAMDLLPELDTFDR
jgi:hypothetical protein